jgi:hypothetical protein
LQQSSAFCVPDHVTPVKDATSAFSKETMHAAYDLNGPSFAYKILTTAELVAALSRESRSSGTPFATRSQNAAALRLSDFSRADA